MPDDWQVRIHRILQGYDSILCAGTSYGKSLVFEGLALLGGKGKLSDGTGGKPGVFIICSLCVAHETACPVFDLSNAKQECKCKKLRETDFEEDKE